MSMGFLRPADYAAVRGPMVSAMVGQMLTTTEPGPRSASKELGSDVRREHRVNTLKMELGRGVTPEIPFVPLSLIWED